MAAVLERYSDPDRFSRLDDWHLFLATKIHREVLRFWNSRVLQSNLVILNAGAGKDDLDLQPSITINLDISESRVRSLAYPLVATVEALPLADSSVDMVVCVGGVINYCDVALVMTEFERVIRQGGYLLLEFESSRSAELMPQKAFGKSAAVAETFYAHQTESIWVYSPKYIKNLLRASGFEVVQKTPIHVLSPWALLLAQSVRLAGTLGRLDSVVKTFPVLTRWASNHFLVCQKSI
jgi:hypothetical protein